MLKSINESMDKKGQVGIALFIGMFITVLVGAILLTASASEVGRTNTLSVVVNESITAPANGSTHTFTGFKQVASVVIFNYTNSTSDFNDILTEDTDFKIVNNLVVDGSEVAQLTVFNDTFSATTGARWNASYTGTPDTYISSGGARSIAGLILVFFALAILVSALIPSIRNKILDSI